MTGPIDVFLVAGQSNAQGRAPDSTLSPDTVAGLAHEYTTAGVVVQLADPVGNANAGSAWPSFANTLTGHSSVPMCISAAAVGGTWLLPEYGTTAGTHWGEGSSLFATSVSRGLATMAGLVSAGWEPTLRGILWSQGEWDGMSGNADPDLEVKYKAALIALFGRYKTALSVPDLRFYVSRTGNHSNYPSGFSAVRAAQEAACAETPGMVMAYTGAIDYLAQGMMSDSFHYTQVGYNLMGDGMGTAVAVDIGYFTPPIPPNVIEIAVLNDQTFLITARHTGQTLYLDGAAVAVSTEAEQELRIHGTGLVELGWGDWDKAAVVAGIYDGDWFTGSQGIASITDPLPPLVPVKYRARAYNIEGGWTDSDVVEVDATSRDVILSFGPGWSQMVRGGKVEGSGTGGGRDSEVHQHVGGRTYAYQDEYLQPITIARTVQLLPATGADSYDAWIAALGQKGRVAYREPGGLTIIGNAQVDGWDPGGRFRSAVSFAVTAVDE